MATASPSQTTESNKALKYKFQKLHATIVNSVNPANIINVLFQEAVIGAVDMRSLVKFSDPQQQCTELLALLHTSENPTAFVHLYAATKNEPDLWWLIDLVDKSTDQPPVAELQQLNVSEPTVGQVVHTLPEGDEVAGVTSLADEIYLLRPKGGRDQVEVYDVIDYSLQRCLTVPNARGFSDMTSCEHHRCVYIGDHIDECIHRLDEQGASTLWAVNDKPRGLSVNAAHNVLVTCPYVHKIKEFSSHGNFIRELSLPGDVTNPLHAVQTSNDEFIVCHGVPGDAVHRVCKISKDGHDIVQSHDGQPSSATGQYWVPCHLSVDNNGYLFVVDFGNRRVTLLSPTLGYICHVVSGDDPKWRPKRLYLDTQKRRLYVADNEWNEENGR